MNYMKILNVFFQEYIKLLQYCLYMPNGKPQVVTTALQFVKDYHLLFCGILPSTRIKEKLLIVQPLILENQRNAVGRS